MAYWTKNSVSILTRNICKATTVTHTKRIDRNLLRKETSFVCYTSSVLHKSRHMKQKRKIYALLLRSKLKITKIEDIKFEHNCNSSTKHSYFNILTRVAHWMTVMWAVHWMAYFDLSKLNLASANVLKLKAFRSWLQW